MIKNRTRSPEIQQVHVFLSRSPLTTYRDGACALFGPDARCVVDEASFAVTSTHLQNATYECRCPHPVNGGKHLFVHSRLTTIYVPPSAVVPTEYVDCLALHLSTSVSESITDVSTPMSVNIGFGQTTFVPSEAAATTATMEETEGMSNVVCFSNYKHFSNSFCLGIML